MTTLEDVTKKRAEPSAEAAAAAELVRLAKEQGLSLTGPDGLLKQFTKTVLETALNECVTPYFFGGGIKVAETISQRSRLRGRPERASSSRPAKPSTS